MASGLKFFERLAEQRRVIRHMRAPIADQQETAVFRQTIVDDAEIDVRRRVGLPVVVARWQVREHVVLGVIPAALDPARNIPTAVFRDETLQRREKRTVGGGVVILMRLKGVERGLGSLRDVGGRCYRRPASARRRLRCSGKGLADLFRLRVQRYAVFGLFFCRCRKRSLRLARVWRTADCPQRHVAITDRLLHAHGNPSGSRAPC